MKRRKRYEPRQKRPKSELPERRPAEPQAPRLRDIGQITALGGDGGVIALTPGGQAAWSFNTSGMYRARMADDQPLVVCIYKDDP